MRPLLFPILAVLAVVPGWSGIDPVTRLAPGAVVRVRPIGVLIMHDEAGQDEKILAVPVEKLNPYYKNVRSYTDLPEILIRRIAQFFEHYKDLEEGKWVKVAGWHGPEEAERIILQAMEAVKKAG